jgi:hypothetical protein
LMVPLMVPMLVVSPAGRQQGAQPRRLVAAKPDRRRQSGYNG